MAQASFDNTDLADYKASGALEGKVAIVTGASSGIGQAVAIAYAKEGARVVIGYLDDDEGAEKTLGIIQSYGGEARALGADLGKSENCDALVNFALEEFGALDIVVNNAGFQYPQTSPLDISDEQMLKTFEIKAFAMFYLVRAALPHLKKGSRIINTASINAYRGHSDLIDYSGANGAMVAMTRSLARRLVREEIAVNGIAPGPIWTPLITKTFGDLNPDVGSDFGEDVPAGRPGQPYELVKAYVFLADPQNSYMTGQFLHMNGGDYMST
ncbi:MULTISPECIES: SDR family oxidoreductase [unclassified Planococcus (in: firmicutes)]|uniref:SDR family oxidoreductase n=1 Tax=Planococcus TaxID=1372 RepID=UPI000C333E83|nr:MULTISPECIES: SDR family oxidoreductase [unclassified Planococcus (in: firmicutes)]AUD12784.1 NAD(P)-dependent oxidoreductase [Planococcus sp. MB-3u-03]PKG47403.1 NAD(P)-dependent oxidoreductase [Planococcus sp. Urea-trap-24]PKG88273.1 NAD(P)-dependent oxidoreductase [Planococcus sp. Urea-3u-39]PKH36802.1 NAD(P)-dependent oxidoreductase [Planococcus sp. MB-3u-09]